MCHLVLLMPVFGLAVFFVLSLPVALVVYLAILGVSILLYKAVIDAMSRRVVTGREAMLGTVASVKRVKSGRVVVCLRGELWTARATGFTDAAPQCACYPGTSVGFSPLTAPHTLDQGAQGVLHPKIPLADIPGSHHADPTWDRPRLGGITR